MTTGTSHHWAFAALSCGIAFGVIEANQLAVRGANVGTIGLPAHSSPDNPTSGTFRTHFADFKGSYVMHCHILAHEDMGMMQTVEVV